MFAWLKRLVRRPAASDRRIFSFWDGTRRRSIDPLPAWAAFNAAMGQDVETALRAMYKQPPPGCVGVLLERYLSDKEATAVKIADAACAAFAIEPFADDADGVRGLTRADRIALARDYLVFMLELAEGSAPFVKRSGPASHSPTSTTASTSVAG